MERTGNIARWVRWQQQPKPRSHEALTFGALLVLLGAGMVLLVWCVFQGCEARPAEAAEISRPFTTQVSYYTVQSAINEGTCTDAAHRRCLQANGKALNDQAYTCASWDFPFGTTLEIKSQTGRVTRCVVSDRGPSRKLYHRGRKLDVSYATAQALGIVHAGIGTVEITEVTP